MEAITFTIEDSASGKNAHILPCDTVGQRRYYSVCLRIINDQENANMESAYPDCISAIKKKTCPALKMRKEETEAGKAIYFKPREVATITPFVPESLIAEPRKIEAPKRKSDNIFEQIENVSYANVLNEVMKAKPVSPPATVEEKPVVPVGAAKSGESLLDMAKRMLAAKS